MGGALAAGTALGALAAPPAGFAGAAAGGAAHAAATPAAATAAPRSSARRLMSVGHVGRLALIAPSSPRGCWFALR
jgi:hypothetical protein